MAKHKFEFFDIERLDVVVGVMNERCLSFYVTADPLAVVATEKMDDDDYRAVWAALEEYNARPDALRLP